jgi:hypothetical protein
MTDDPNKRGEPDRSKVSGGQSYEVGYFATKHGLSIEQARELINRAGNNREKLDEAAKRLKSTADGVHLAPAGGARKVIRRRGIERIIATRERSGIGLRDPERIERDRDRRPSACRQRRGGYRSPEATVLVRTIRWA